MGIAGHLRCRIQYVHIVLLPRMQILEGQLLRGVVFSVTPQQAAVVLVPGACFNYCIISPPTLSLTSGESQGPPEQFEWFIFFFFKILNIRLVLYSKTVKSTLSQKLTQQ